jgi:hypothetical protein
VSSPEIALPGFARRIFEFLVLKRVSDPPIQEAWLPYISFDFQVLIQLKRKSSLDQLHGPFQGDSSGSNDQVKMVRHDNKFMQQILFLPLAVTKVDSVVVPIDEESSKVTLSG